MQSRLSFDKLNAAVQNAVACEEATGVPAELMVAQWALESGWGAHEPGNNCFGIKSYPRCYGVQLLATTEFEGGVPMRVDQEFATFPTLTACFEKHAELISKGTSYRRVWQQYRNAKSVTELVKGIAPIYATAPNYASAVLGIISMPEVASSITKARVTQPVK